MVGHLIHHLAIRVPEKGVVLEKIAMPVDMRHHQLLVHRMVATHQIGVARVVVDDHLVNLGKPVIVALLELLEGHSERPVRITGGEAPIRRDFVEIFGIDDLEDRLVKIEAVPGA